MVRAKFYRRSSCGEEQEALARVADLFQRGPRQKYDAPVTTSHEYVTITSTALQFPSKRVIG